MISACKGNKGEKAMCDFPKMEIKILPPLAIKVKKFGSFPYIHINTFRKGSISICYSTQIKICLPLKKKLAVTAVNRTGQTAFLFHSKLNS